MYFSYFFACMLIMIYIYESTAIDPIAIIFNAFFCTFRRANCNEMTLKKNYIILDILFFGHKKGLVVNCLYGFMAEQKSLYPSLQRSIVILHYSAL